MNIFNNPILITLSSSGLFVAIVTYDQMHGRSQRFLLSRDILHDQLRDHDEGSNIERDLHNFCDVARARDGIRFRLSWLRNCGDELKGYQQRFIVPVDLVSKALAGKTVKYMYYEPIYKNKAPLSFTRSAYEEIAGADKLKRHAIRRFFRDHFDYGNTEHFVIQRDPFIHGFYFHSMVINYNGGIALHETEVTGKDGKNYPKLYYGLHT